MVVALLSGSALFMYRVFVQLVVVGLSLYLPRRLVGFFAFSFEEKVDNFNKKGLISHSLVMSGPFMCLACF